MTYDHYAYLGLGANLGDRVANLREAIRRLAGSGSCVVTAVSSLYATSPVGIEDQPEFVNAVIRVNIDSVSGRFARFVRINRK